MSYNEEHIFQLILEKLSGDISDDNWKFLQTAMEQDDSVKRCMDEMEEALKSAGPEFMNDVYNERAWGSVLSILQPQGEDVKTPAEVPAPAMVAVSERKRPVAAWLIAAATFVLIATTAFFLISGNNTPHNNAPVAANTLPYKGNIRLMLASGDSMMLNDEQSQDVALNNARLQTLPGQLRFDAGSSDGRMNELTVPTGKDYEVVLSDGSTVHLNAYSSIRFPFAFTGKTREVYIEGEAYFKIAPNATQPFIVHTAHTAVKVLGTSFNINAYNDGPVVTSLVQGSIMTGAGDHPDLLLHPGQETVFHDGKQTVEPFDSAVTLGWTKGEYPYYNQSLNTLASVIYRWYGKTILFDDPALADKKLTGIIERNHSLSEFLESLVKTSGINYKISGNEVHLTAK
jgi:transmembrane sensor